MAGKTDRLQQLEDSILAQLDGQYKMTRLDPGSFALLRVKGILKFHTSQYRLENLGNLAIMKVDTFMMKMISVVLTPIEKDAPLLSIDCIYIFGKCKIYIELFNLNGKGTAETAAHFKPLSAAYSDLKDIPVKPSWQDSIMSVAIVKEARTKDNPRLFELQNAAFKELLDICTATTALQGSALDAHKADIEKYYNNLIAQGGTSTDVFKSSLGEETTRSFFAKVLFGTENC